MFNFIRHLQTVSQSDDDFHSQERGMRSSCSTSSQYSVLSTSPCSLLHWHTLAIRPWSHSQCFSAYGPVSAKILQQSGTERAQPPIMLGTPNLISSVTSEISASPWPGFPASPLMHWLQCDSALPAGNRKHLLLTLYSHELNLPDSRFWWTGRITDSRCLYPCLYPSSGPVSLCLCPAMCRSTGTHWHSMCLEQGLEGSPANR